AIVGSYTFADVDSGAAFGGDAIGLGLNFFVDTGSCAFPPGCINPDCPIDPFERFIKHSTDPSFDCHTELPKIQLNSIDVQTFSPETLDISVVVLLALQEQNGNGPTQSIEIGPRTSPITANATFYDNTEAATSLPSVSIKCSVFGSLRPE